MFEPLFLFRSDIKNLHFDHTLSAIKIFYTLPIYYFKVHTIRSFNKIALPTTSIIIKNKIPTLI